VNKWVKENLVEIERDETERIYTTAKADLETKIAYFTDKKIDATGDRNSLLVLMGKVGTTDNAYILYQ
jgi:hypothetical protein